MEMIAFHKQFLIIINLITDKSRGTFCSLASESGDRLFFLFSLRSFEKKHNFAWLYCLAKIMLKRVLKGKFPFSHRYWLCQ